jgi:hypothetical protein
MAKIRGAGVSTNLNTFGNKSAGKSTQVQKPVGEQIEEELFGKKKPPPLDPDDFPDLDVVLKKLDAYRVKLARYIGDRPEEYQVSLAKGTIACIDKEGDIAFGAQFLKNYGHANAVTVGVLAHEIGHRPKTWRNNKKKQNLSKDQIYILCKEEETKADYFAGRALAELGFPCEPLIQFLMQVEEGPHPEYFPARMRADVIREAHGQGAFRAKSRKAMFPDMDRHTAARNHLGEG